MRMYVYGRYPRGSTRSIQIFFSLTSLVIKLLWTSQMKTKNKAFEILTKSRLKKLQWKDLQHAQAMLTASSSTVPSRKHCSITHLSYTFLQLLYPVLGSQQRQYFTTFQGFLSTVALFENNTEKSLDPGNKIGKSQTIIWRTTHLFLYSNSRSIHSS